MNRSGRVAVAGLFCIATVVMLTATSEAQRPRRGGGGAGFFGGGATGNLFLLRNEEVGRELELVDEQRARLDKVNDEIRDQMRDLFTRGRDLSDEERRAQFQEFGEKVQKQVDGILLPHQRDRLKQIALQQQLRRSGGTGGALASSTMVEELGITEAQKEELAKVRKETEAELQKQIAKLRKEAEAKILKVLTREQQAKWEKMMGEQFEFQSTPFGFGGGNRGPGAGGNRGPGAGGRRGRGGNRDGGGNRRPDA